MIAYVLLVQAHVILNGQDQRVLRRDEAKLSAGAYDVFDQDLGMRGVSCSERLLAWNAHLAGQGVAVVNHWLTLIAIPAINLLQRGKVRDKLPPLPTLTYDASTAMAQSADVGLQI